jgi:hypothetical protein
MAEQSNQIKLSSFAELRAVKGAIKTAPVLAMGDGPVTRVEVASKVKLPQITAEDSVDTVVIKFIRENPNLNEDEIVGALNPILQMPDKITAALQQLYRAGLVMQTPVLVDGTTLTVYRAKHKAIFDLAKAQDAASIVPAKPFKLPEAAPVDPNGKIVYEQGLDIAIWKIMQDREWRSIDDIGALLHTYGFHVYAVKTRVKTLFDLGVAGVRWFDSTRKNKSRHHNPLMYYKLRAGVECPKPGILGISLEASESQEKSGDDAVNAILSGNSVFSVHSQAPSAEATTQSVKESTVEYDTEIRQGDHFPVVLWKLMVGKKDLRVKALGELVAPYGFEASQVASLVNAWLKEGYVRRVERKEESSIKPVGFYTLVDMEMPAFPKSARSSYAVLPQAQAESAPVAAAAANTGVQDSEAVDSFTPISFTLIQNGDSISLCVVKVLLAASAPMHLSELVVLLTIWGFSSSQIYSCVQSLSDRGIVVRVAEDGGEVNVRTSPVRINVTYLPEFPVNKRTPLATPYKGVAKELSEDALAASPAAKGREAPTQERATDLGSAFKTVKEPEPLDAYLEQRESQCAQQARADAPLVRHLVMIKGVEFTLAEIDQIVAEMNALKLFAWVGMSGRTVKAKFEIKGVELTPEELNEVLLSMK